LHAGLYDPNQVEIAQEIRVLAQVRRRPFEEAVERYAMFEPVVGQRRPIAGDPSLCLSVGSGHMPFRHLLLSLALALIVAGPLPARADDPPAKDVAAIGDCLRKQENKKGGTSAGHRRKPKRPPA
jgi:hypothetical protein